MSTATGLLCPTGRRRIRTCEQKLVVKKYSKRGLPSDWKDYMQGYAIAYIWKSYVLRNIEHCIKRSLRSAERRFRLNLQHKTFPSKCKLERSRQNMMLEGEYFQIPVNLNWCDGRRVTDIHTQRSLNNSILNLQYLSISASAQLGRGSHQWKIMLRDKLETTSKFSCPK